MKLIPVDKSEEHYLICKAWLEDKEITKWLVSALRFARYLKVIHEMLLSNRKNRLFFISHDEGFVGLVGLTNIDMVDKRAEVWYLVGSQSDRGKNIATRAVGLIKGVALQDLQLVTLYAQVPEPNKTSVRVLEKNGFQYVGKFRKAFFLDGSYRDFLIFDWVKHEKTSSL